MADPQNVRCHSRRFECSSILIAQLFCGDRNFFRTMVDNHIGALIPGSQMFHLKLRWILPARRQGEQVVGNGVGEGLPDEFPLALGNAGRQ